MPALKPRRSKAASSADQFIGTRLRECRMAFGLNQRQLAELISVTNQQVHKYEHAITRVSAGRLYEIARVLGAPIEYFFEALERDEGQLPQQRHRLLDVMRHLVEIKDEKQLEAVGQLVRALAGH